MIDQYSIHNLFWEQADQYFENDPQLRNLKNFRFVHPLDWWKEIDWKKPGIYLLTGGRQVGKTTSLKLLVKEQLLKKSFQAENIFYLPCDQIENHLSLGEIIRFFLKKKTGAPFLLLIDEITYVEGWDRAIKAIADEGSFQDGFCILTGSDSVILKEAVSRFPGRRGEAEKIDFFLRPLSFKEYVELVGSEFLDQAFEEYLQCGGHLRAINDWHKHGSVLPATYTVFEQWIQGDFGKRGKSVRELLGVLKMLLETLGSQVTYSSLTQRMGEISKPTFINYCDLLERQDILFTLQAYDQNKRIGFPKKGRKFHFWDPFILETFRRWLMRERLLSDINLKPQKVESVVASHFKKEGDTYYFKGGGEIDVVSIRGGKPVYIEVKWTNQLRSADLAELKKRRPAVILTKGTEGKIENIPAIPISKFLVHPAFSK